MTKIYVGLTFNIMLDLFLNRKFWMKLGRKFCLPQSIKMEFKRIKACKRQMKFAQLQLDSIKY